VAAVGQVHYAGHCGLVGLDFAGHLPGFDVP